MNSQVDTKPKAMSLDEAARYVGIGKTTLYALSRTGKVRLLKVGRKSVVLTADLDAFVDSLVQQVA